MRPPFFIAFCFLAVTPAQAVPWVRSFVIDHYEPAFYYGGPPGSTDAPGTDCPKGTNPDNDYKALLKAPWRGAARLAELTRPASIDVDPFGLLAPELGHRGFAKDIDTYINPFAAPDPGLQQVTGRIAEGFDLDGNPRSGGFVSPSGETGIDNALYRALGCLMSFRGAPYHAALSRLANDRMLDGLYTMVIRLSGTKDPMNDGDVLVEIGYSPDPVAKDGQGHVLRDYSFRLARSAQYTRLKGRIVKGVLTTRAVAALRLPEFSWSQSNRGEALFQQGQLRLTVQADGTAGGLIGGYRDWRELYGKDTFNLPQEGPGREIVYHQNQIALYYALGRNADAIPDPATGRNTAISTAYRFTVVPAFAIDAVPPAPIAEPLPSGRSQLQRSLFRRAAATATIAPGVRRAGNGGSEEIPVAPSAPN